MIIARYEKLHLIQNKKYRIEYNAYQTGAQNYKIVETFPNGTKKHYEFTSFDSMNDAWTKIKETTYEIH